MIAPCEPCALGRWEVNPATSVCTRRCARCGRVLEHMTNAEALRARTDDPISAPPKETAK